MPAQPKLKFYGDSGGTYEGRLLTDSAPRGELGEKDLNKNAISDTEEFNKFEEYVRDFVLSRLGHPVVRVELTPFQVKTCIDEACTKLSYHTPLWGLNYAAFEASAGVGVYELPPHIINNLSYVVYKKSLLSTNYPAQSFESDAFISFFAGYQRNQYMNIGDFLLLQQHMEMMRKVLSNEGTFNVIDNKYVQLYPTPHKTPTEVIVEYRAINTNTIHPFYLNWIQKYTLAIAKMVLGEIRSKYKSLPSPGGGAILNGTELKNEGKAEKELLEKELLSEIEEPPVFTMF
jgi:hypothetical protein